MADIDDCSVLALAAWASLRRSCDCACSRRILTSLGDERSICTRVGSTHRGGSDDMGLIVLVQRLVHRLGIFLAEFEQLP